MRRPISPHPWLRVRGGVAAVRRRRPAPVFKDATMEPGGYPQVTEMALIPSLRADSRGLAGRASRAAFAVLPRPTGGMMSSPCSRSSPSQCERSVTGTRTCTSRPKRRHPSTATADVETPPAVAGRRVRLPRGLISAADPTLPAPLSPGRWVFACVWILVAAGLSFGQVYAVGRHNVQSTQMEQAPATLYVVPSPSILIARSPYSPATATSNAGCRRDTPPIY